MIIIRSSKKGLSLGTASVLAFLSLSAPTIFTPQLPCSSVYAQTGAKVRSLPVDFVAEPGCPVVPTALRCELDVDPFDAPMDARVYLDYRNNSDRAVSAVKFRLRFVDAQGVDKGTFHAVDMVTVSPQGGHGLKAKRDFTLHPAVVALKARVLQVKYSDGSDWSSVKMQELARPGGAPAPVAAPAEESAPEPAATAPQIPGQDPNSPNEAFDSGNERKHSKHSRNSSKPPSRGGSGGADANANANAYPSGSSVGSPNPRVYENLPPGAAQSVQTIGPGAESAPGADLFNPGVAPPAAAAPPAQSAPYNPAAAAPAAAPYNPAASAPPAAMTSQIPAAAPPATSPAQPSVGAAVSPGAAAAAGAAAAVSPGAAAAAGAAASAASTAPGTTPAVPADGAVNPANSPYTSGRYKGVQPLNVPYSPENDK